MARRVSDPSRGEHLPQLAVGIRARAAYLSSGFPGIGTPHRDALDRGERVALTGTDVWSALFAVDPAAARVFGVRCPWRTADASVFVYDPVTGMLAGPDCTERSRPQYRRR